jgi:hypothetical protein
VEKVDLLYRIEGPVPKARSVDLVVASAKEPDKVLGRVHLPEPYKASAKFNWDGALAENSFIGLKGSPFVMWFVLESKSGKVSESEKLKVAVELHSVELTAQITIDYLAPPKEESSVRALIKELTDNGMPGSSHGKLIIDSALFKTASSEMNDGSSYSAYAAFGDGYELPLFARLFIKGKDGTRKISTRATTGTRVLWRVQTPSAGDYDALLGSQGVHAAAKTFMKKVAGQEAADARPAGGYAAPVRLGGKKTSAEGRTGAGFYWKSAGSDWGFRVPDKRPWDAFSLAGGEVPEGDVGISFLGGRLASQRHTVSAIADLDEKLDVPDDGPLDGAPANRRSNTLAIDLWRRVPIVRSLKIGAVQPLDLAPVNVEYNKAAMRIDGKPGMATEDAQADWKTHYASLATFAATDAFLEHAFLPDSGDHPTAFRPFNDYWERANANIGFFGRLGHRIASFFGAGGEDEYYKQCDGWAYRLYATVVQHFPITDDGMMVVKFAGNGEYDQQGKSGKITAGIAPSIPGFTSQTKALFFTFNKKNDPGTFSHEVGHTLFLAHAPGHWKSGQQPGGHQPNAHDKDQICLMSYHPDAKNFCGLCLLKLGGWRAEKIPPDGSIKL